MAPGLWLQSDPRPITKGVTSKTEAQLSKICLKLLDKERRSHINDFNFDEALGLFAGLNVLPKKSSATDYSYRTTRSHQDNLLSRWVAAWLRCCSPSRRHSASISTPSPIAATPRSLENHYLPRAARPAPSILTLLRPRATKPGPVLCQRQPHSRRPGRRSDALRRLLAWPDRPRSPVALLRLQGSSPMPNWPRSTSGNLVRHHPPPWSGHPPTPERRAGQHLAPGRHRHSQTAPQEHPLSWTRP